MDDHRIIRSLIGRIRELEAEIEELHEDYHRTLDRQHKRAESRIQLLQYEVTEALQEAQAERMRGWR